MNEFDKPFHLMTNDELYAEAAVYVEFFLELGFDRDRLISILNDYYDGGPLTDGAIAALDKVLKKKLN